MANGSNGKISFANVFQVFAKERHNICTLHIQKETGLSLPSISRILNAMIAEGIIVLTDQSKGKVGRASRLYSLCSDYRYVVGIYVDKACTFISLGTFNGKLLSTVQIPTKDKDTPLLQRIMKEIDCLLSSTLYHTKGQYLGAISFCISAMVVQRNRGNPSIISPDIEELRNADIVRTFSDYYHTQVFVERDTNACLISRMNEENGCNYQNVALVSIGDGIGCALAINGSVFRGSNGFAGEVRNMVIGNCSPDFVESSRSIWCRPEDSPLEIFNGAKSVLKCAYQAYQADTGSYHMALEALHGDAPIARVEDVRLEWLDTLAARGEQTAITLLHTPIQSWASVVINLCCCMDPEAVFLGGQLGIHTPYICNSIQALTNRHVGFSIPVIGIENDSLIRKAATDYALACLYETIHDKYLVENDESTSVKGG